MSRKYCGMCDREFKTTSCECPACGFDLERLPKPTRSEKEQGLADRGTDTREEYEEKR